MTLWLECGALHEHEGPDALQRALEEHEADVRADERAHMASAIERMRAAALPASVVEAMAQIASGKPMAEEVLSALADHADEAVLAELNADDTVAIEAATRAAACALHALAILIAEQEQSR